MPKNEIDRLREIEATARLLFASLDLADPEWRVQTLNLPDGVGDCVNVAWDRLAAALDDRG